jgi:uncharacterized protein (DUF1800 family)
MGDENTPLSDAEARHLLRRTGFGVNTKTLGKILKDEDVEGDNETRGQAADRLLDFTPSKFRPRARDIELTHNKWVKYMIRAKSELQEKLTLFWHDHFATSFATVGDVKLMANQNQLLRLNCKGNFKAFVKAINLDAAMMEFLDTVRNKKQQPNENYPRELNELFCLGVKDLTPAAEPNYDQEDIVQIARAFTGWREDDGKPYFTEGRHDYNAEFLAERGPKVIFKNRGGFNDPSGQDFTINGEGEPEIDTVIDIIFQHKDSEGKNTVARYIAHRLLTYFAYADPALSVVDDVIATSGFDTNFEIAPLLRAIFCHDAFYETMAPAPFGPATKKSVKWPIDLVVGTLRTLRMKAKSKYQYIDGGRYNELRDLLTDMGQRLFEPPSVFGWDWEDGWLSSATLLARYTFVRDATSARGGGGASFRPERLFTMSETNPGDIVDAVTDLLGVKDQISSADRDALIDYLTNGAGAGASVNLLDDELRDEKLNGLVAIALQSPAYQLH